MIHTSSFFVLYRYCMILLSSNLRFNMIPAVCAPVSELSEHEAKQIRDVSEQEEAEVHLSSWLVSNRMNAESRLDLISTSHDLILTITTATTIDRYRFSKKISQFVSEEATTSQGLTRLVSLTVTRCQPSSASSGFVYTWILRNL